MEKVIITKYTCLDGFSENIAIEVCNDSKKDSVAFNVDTLAPFYYLGSKSENNPVSRKDQAFKPIEFTVNQIKNKKEWTPKDVYRILAWKMGKIQQIKLEDEYKNDEGVLNHIFEPRFKYARGWSQDDSDESSLKLQFRNSNTLSKKQFSSLAQKVIDLHNCYINKSKNSNEIWKELLAFANDDKNKLKGLGTVYLITLLSFITKGDEPIVDRFVLASLAVLRLKKVDKNIKVPEGSIIRGCYLPDKKTKEAKELMEPNSIYKQYCSLLKEEFPKEKWKEREVDQALWVYGHYFKVI